jgi:hypothetical protein
MSLTFLLHVDAAEAKKAAAEAEKKAEQGK